MEMVLDFSPEGVATGLHFDEFPLTFLGKLRVERASEIIFNTDTQLWDAHIFGICTETLVVEGFSGYDKTRHFEVEFIQMCRKRPESSDAHYAFLAKVLHARFCSTQKLQ